MRRWLLLPILVVALAPLVAGEDVKPQHATVPRAGQFERNSSLIQALVQNGLRLAAEDDPLKRAECCNSLVERLSTEITEAARARESARVSELGQYLNELLSGGVAVNLRGVHKQLQQGSTREKSFREVKARTERLLQRLEEQLRQEPGYAGQDLAAPPLKVIREGRLEVENMLEDKSDSERGSKP